MYGEFLDVHHILAAKYLIKRYFNGIIANLDKAPYKEACVMKNRCIEIWKTQRGQGLTEYAMILVFICLACVVIVGSLGQILNNVWYAVINEAWPGS